MPEGDAWEGAVVFWFELGDDVKREAGLLGYLSVAAFVVFAVANFFAHETVSIMSVKWCFCESLIVTEISCPSKSGPNKSSNSRVHVSSFDRVKEGGISEDVPNPPSDTVRFS